MIVTALSLCCLLDAPLPAGAAPDPVEQTWTAPRRVDRAAFAGAPPGGAAAGTGRDLTFLSTNHDPEGDMPRDVAFTPDGTTAVMVNRDTDNLTFFDVATRSITHTVAVGDVPVDVAVTPDGRYAVAPNVFSNTVSVVDIASHTVAAHVPITGEQPFQVAITSDSAYAVAAVINDGTSSAFSVIDLDALAEVRTIPTTGQGVIGFFLTPEPGISGNIFSQFALSPDDTTLVLPDRVNGRVMLYDLTTGAETAALTVDASPTAVDVSSDGTLAVVSHQSGVRRITEIDLVNQAVGDVWTTAADLTEQVIRITPDKSHAIAAISNNVIFVNLNTGVTTATLSTGVVGDIEISFDGQYAFVSNANARVIDIATQTVVSTIPVAPCADAATSPVALRAVALNNRFGEDIHLYDINGAAGFFEGRALSGEPPEGDATRTLAMSPDGTTVVAANNTSRNVSIINVASGAVRAYIDTGTRPLGVAVGPDGVTAVVCNADEDTVSVIDLATDTNVADLAVASRPADVRISPDGGTAYVISVAGSDRLHFIDLNGPDSSVTGSILTGQMGSMGYTYGVTSGMAISPDGSIVALCYSFDDQLGLVDTGTQSEILRVPVGDFPIQVAFAPDNARAYVVNAIGDSLSVVRISGAHSYVEATVPGIEFPLPVDVDAAGAFVYVGSWDGSDPSIKVVDTSLNSIVQSVSLPGYARAAHLSSAAATLYVATTEGQLARVSAAGPLSALIDETPLSAGPSDLAFSESRRTAVVAQPIPDGVDRARFVPLGDIDLDGIVGVNDFLLLLAAWGPCPAPTDPCPADLDGDGMVGVTDFLIILANWS